MVTAVYFFSICLSHFLGDKIVSVLSPKRALAVGSALTALYVAVYLFPVVCGGKSNGLCSHALSGVLLFAFAFIGGCGTSITWTAKSVYLRQCSDSETESKNNTIFSMVFGFGGVLAALFGLSLLINEKLRTGLYVVMSVLSVNSVAMQICTALLEL